MFKEFNYNNPLLRSIMHNNMDSNTQMSPLPYLMSTPNPSFKGYMGNSLLPGILKGFMGNGPSGMGAGGMLGGSGLGGGGGENPLMSIGTNYLFGKLFK